MFALFCALPWKRMCPWLRCMGSKQSPECLTTVLTCSLAERRPGKVLRRRW